ncbi:MAG: ArsR family transcriptional regulator [Candidatus Methanodesulfokora sp.]
MHVLNSKGEIYRTVFIPLGSIRAISSDLAEKILIELSKGPKCAADIARSLGEAEQKVHYHMRKLRDAGLIKISRTEERGGGTAKLYELVSGVISVKLSDEEPIKIGRVKDPGNLRPFVEEGKLNSIIVVGSPEPHGRYRAPASDGYAAISLALYLGSFLEEQKIPAYKLDTQLRESDLKENLILVGGPKANTISDEVNGKMKAWFEYSDERKEWIIRSPWNSYFGKGIGVIARGKNPFNEEKEVLLLAGTGFRGSSAAIIGLKKFSELVKRDSALIVRGIDVDGDGIMDDCELLETI